MNRPNEANEQQRRRALRSFLFDCRGRLLPRDVGIQSIGPRRCKGLRREEVAELAGVTVAWYTLFETARANRRVSLKMLDRVASALLLSDEDRSVLFRLAVPEISVTTEYSVRESNLTRAFDVLGKMTRSVELSISVDAATNAIAQGLKLIFDAERVEETRLATSKVSKLFTGCDETRSENDERDSPNVSHVDPRVLDDGSLCFAIAIHTEMRSVFLVVPKAPRQHAPYELDLLKIIVTVLRLRIQVATQQQNARVLANYISPVSAEGSGSYAAVAG